MGNRFTESVVEEAALDWLAGLGYAVAHGPEIIETERGGDYGRVVLADRLRAALVRLNPKVPDSAIEEAFRKLTALRDSLLPKLISGELRVPDAERIVGRAV